MLMHDYNIEGSANSSNDRYEISFIGQLLYLFKNLFNLSIFWKGTELEILEFECLGSFYSYSYYYYYFIFLGPHPQHMEVPRLGVELECGCQPIPQPQQRRILAMSVIYTTAHSNSGSFNPWSEARDLTHILMNTSWAHYC